MGNERYGQNKKKVLMINRTQKLQKLEARQLAHYNQTINTLISSTNMQEEGGSDILRENLSSHFENLREKLNMLGMMQWD
jgi:hypothetical protein